VEEADKKVEIQVCEEVRVGFFEGDSS